MKFPTLGDFTIILVIYHASQAPRLGFILYVLFHGRDQYLCLVRSLVSDDVPRRFVRRVDEAVSVPLDNFVPWRETHKSFNLLPQRQTETVKIINVLLQQYFKYLRYVATAEVDRKKLLSVQLQVSNNSTRLT